MEYLAMFVLIFALFLIGVGVGECFYGFRIFNFLLRVIGFIFGAGIMWILASRFGPVAGGVCAAIGAIVGVLIAVPLHVVGVFLMGASSGFVLSIVVAKFLEMEGLAIVAAIPLAILGGILAVWLRRPVIIISSAITGSSWVCFGSLFLFALIQAGLGSVTGIHDLPIPNLTDYVFVAAWVVLSIVGMVFQFHNTANMKTPRREPEDYRQNTVLG